MPGKKRRRRGISLGSVIALAFTAAVLFGCFAIVARMTGDDMDATRVFHALTQTLDIPGWGRGSARQTSGVLQASGALNATPAPTAALPAAASATPTPTPAPTARVVSIQAVGTIAAPKNVRQSVYASESKTYDFTEIFDGVRDTLLEGDLTIATVETLFAGQEAGYGNYNAPSQLLDALKSSGMDLLSLATERGLELGFDALMVTVAQVQSRGFLAAGVYEREEDAGSAQIFQINDVQVAVLAYTYDLSDNAKKKTRSAYRFSIPLSEMESMRADIANARKAGAELVIVLPHWGTKNKEATPSNVYAMAQQLADAGADLILGTHPNIVQGVERIVANRADGTQPVCYAAYSLGSFLTDSRDETNTAGVILSLRAQVDPLTRQLTLCEPTYVPTYIHRYKSDDLYHYLIVETDDGQAVSQLDESAQKAAAGARQRVNRAIGEGAKERNAE